MPSIRYLIGIQWRADRRVVDLESPSTAPICIQAYPWDLVDGVHVFRGSYPPTLRQLLFHGQQSWIELQSIVD